MGLFFTRKDVDQAYEQGLKQGKSEAKWGKKEYEELRERKNEQIHALEKKNKKLVEAAEENHATINQLENTVADAQEIEAKEIELEGREKIIEAKTSSYDNFTGELKKVKEEAKTEGDSRHKEGYADGLADGLRKAHEITAEDRKTMASVAALAAASHSSDATQTIADGIVKEMNAARQLTTGKKK